MIEIFVYNGSKKYKVQLKCLDYEVGIFAIYSIFSLDKNIYVDPQSDLWGFIEDNIIKEKCF